MNTIKIPIEYGRDGFAQVTDDTDDYYKQLLSITARTERDMSPLFPEFGVQDPTFNIVDNGVFLINASKYIPEIISQLLQRRLRKKSLLPILSIT